MIPLVDTPTSMNTHQHTSMTRGGPMRHRRAGHTTAIVMALALPVLGLTACSSSDPAPSASTTTAQQDIRGGHSPHYTAGAKSYDAFLKMQPNTDSKLPAAAKKVATPAYIRQTNASNHDFWTTDSGGKFTRATGHGWLGDWKGQEIRLATKTQPWTMTIRACVKSNKAYYRGKKKVLGGKSSAPATVHFLSPDKGKTWLVSTADFNDKTSQVKVPC